MYYIGLLAFFLRLNAFWLPFLGVFCGFLHRQAVAERAFLRISLVFCAFFAQI